MYLTYELAIKMKHIEQINYFVKERNHQKIALMIQADEFGYMVESNLIKL